MKLLLLTTGSDNNSKYNVDEREWIKAHFANAKKILFIPYAQPQQEYVQCYVNAEPFFTGLNMTLISAHHLQPEVLVATFDQFDGIYIAGGNSFLLLEKLYQTELIKVLTTKIQNGMPCVTANADIMCPTIGTTNDMPIVNPASLYALNIINFQINSKYDYHRKQNIQDYHKVNQSMVVGLRENSALSVTDKNIELLGQHPVRVFKHDVESFEIKPEETVRLNKVLGKKTFLKADVLTGAIQIVNREVETLFSKKPGKKPAQYAIPEFKAKL